MLKHARGVLCAPITLSRCKELDLPHQVANNTSVLGTPFTVTIDKLEGCSTGVSAADRAATIRALADPSSTPETFGRPGHINPLYAQDKGVLRRAGHTEASIDLAKLAGLLPCRRPHGSDERRRHHGAPSRIAPNGRPVRLQAHLHRRPHRIPPETGIAGRERRRGRHAYRIRALPADSFPPKKQRAGTRGINKRESSDRTSRYWCVYIHRVLRATSSVRCGAIAETSFIKPCK